MHLNGKAPALEPVDSPLLSKPPRKVLFHHVPPTEQCGRNITFAKHPPAEKRCCSKQERCGAIG